MSEYVNYLHEVFRDFGPIHSRRMFGGHGIYHQGLMFGLVADDVLYLKSDDGNRQRFIQAGLEPFEYVKNQRRMQMSYYRAPDEIHEDPEVARAWALMAYEAALRGRSKQPKGQRRRRQSKGE
ncbi:MAG: TfoX/Sxy family protein [Wenzhouxiangellaceae bacterium]